LISRKLVFGDLSMTMVNWSYLKLLKRRNLTGSRDYEIKTQKNWESSPCSRLVKMVKVCWVRI